MIRISLFIVFLISICSCQVTPQLQVYSGNALGTTFTIQFFSEEELNFSLGIDSTLTVLNNSLSTYMPSSDISKINQGDTSIVVDQQFIDNFLTSKIIFKETDGFFDPSVGLFVNAYGFGPIRYNLDMSNSYVRDSLMQFVGFDKVQLTKQNQIKSVPGTFLDFNAIAKGYAVDRLGVLLEHSGVTNYLVELGGELVGKGLNLSTNSPWRVGIDDPNDIGTERSFSAIIKLDGFGMATSGNYRKFLVDDKGNRFVHTINPKTGLSTKSDVLSATVLAPTCMEADAYATALMALGSEKAIEFLNQKKDVFALLYIAKNKETELFKSKGFDMFLLE